MIIATKTANRLVRMGLAEKVGTVTSGEKTYEVINRYDVQRTDHCEVKDK